MARLLLQCSTPDEDDPSYHMVVEVTPEVVEELKGRMRLFDEVRTRDKELWDMWFATGWFGVYEDLDLGTVLVTDGQQLEFERDEWRFISPSIELPEDKEASADCHQVVVTRYDSVCWFCYQKFLNTPITSAPIPLDKLCGAVSISR